MTATSEYAHSGRNPATLVVLLAVWACLAGAVILLDAAWWLMALLGLFTLPALWDLLSARQAGMRLDDEGLHWHAGRRTGTVAWNRIDRVRLDTRLDLSTRAALVLDTGRKIRLPQEATPPDAELEAELDARGVKVERHHFSLLG